MGERSSPSTIVDVAKAAGVSVATVSRALRGLDRVSPRTRERVRRVAEELDYVASPTATSLASGRTRIVAVVVPYAGRWYYACMVATITKALRAGGYQSLLFDLEQEQPGGRQELTRSMLWKRVDAVISINIALSDTERELLSSLHVPVVSIGFDLPGRDYVGIDNHAMALAAIEHLLDLGHTEIAFIGVEQPAPGVNTIPEERLAAFRHALTARGIPVREEWILATDWTAEHARGLARALITGPGPTPTAVVCASDEIGFGVLVAAAECGLRVPQDLSVTGIDDHNLAGLFSLTTVRQDLAAQGARAAAIVLDRITQQSTADDQPVQVLLDTELIVRSSTSPPPR